MKGNTAGKMSKLTILRFGLTWSLAIMLVAQPPALAAGTPGKTRSKTRNSATLLQGGSSIMLYGPQLFGHQPGPARNVYAQFNLPITTPIAGVIRIQNGDTGGSGRVTGAIIQLNGLVLSTARTINPSTATLNIPVNLQPSNSLSVRINGAPGSFLLMTILAKPVIASVSPSIGIVGNTVTINGDYFDDSGAGQNIARFTKAGGGQTVAQVSSASKTQLAVIVPSDAATGPVSVQTAGGIAVSPANFELISASPVITDFNPKRAPVGASITITGTDLKYGAANPAVTFAGANNTRLPALVTTATATQVIVTVPNAAINGAIELTNPGGKATSGNPFFVEATEDFQITVAPADASAIQGSAANYIVTLTSQQPDFTQLATLSLEGAPAGSTITFLPEQIAAGAASTLGLRTAAGLTTGNYQFTIRATASIDGHTVVRTAQASINVLNAGTTTLSGRVLSNKEEPILGATVSLDGKTATTDSAGNFLLSGINAGTDRPIVVDGRTASAPNRTYPLITEPVTINAGEANIVPYKFYLPAIDTANEVTVVPNQMTVVMTPMAPGLSMTIPANSALVNRDGTAVARASLTTVEVDRTPAPLPPNVGTNIVYTSQPGGARSATGVKIPVVYPNLSGANPGTRIELWNFSTDLAQWYIYGYGRVSADGRVIEPEPGVGLPDFSWHLPNVRGNCDGGNCCKDCPCPVSDKPVELSSGLKIEKATDISFGGERGGLELTRIHTANFAGSCDNCPFGRGWTHHYAIRLTGAFTEGGTGRIFWPEESNGRLFNYLRRDPDGTLVFSTTATPHQLGDLIRKLTNGTYEYRHKSGAVMRFDSSGRLIALVDRNGNTTTLTYTGNNLTQITDAVGRSLTLQYSGDRISSVTDPLSRVWNYSYDGGNRLINVTDPLSQKVSYSYELFSRLASVTDKRGVVIKQITYDNAGRVSEQAMADGGVEQYSYTLSGNMVTGVTMTDPLGRTRSMRFNGAGQVVETTDEFGQVAAVKRDLTTNLALERSGPCGCREDERKYDNQGNTTEITNRLSQVRRFEYEGVFSNVTKIVDRLGRISNYTYDARGNLTSLTNALNQTVSFSYDQFGQLVGITDPLNHTSTLEYDALGNVTAIVDPLGNRTTMEYDLAGRLTAMNDPLSRRSELTYDPLDRILTSKDPNNATTKYAYDPNGNRVSVTNALNQRWERSYDQKNRLIATIDPLNRVTRYRYDLADQLISIISPTGRKVSYGYDSRGQRTQITDGLGGVILMTFDTVGNLKRLTDQRNNTTTFAYDELFRMIAQTDPLGRKTNYGYDAEGNLISIVDRLNRSTTIAYDQLNRRKRIVYADAIVDYTYDAAGRLTNINDTQGGAIGFAYDNANRLMTETTAQGAVGYAYNAAGQRSTMTVPNTAPVTYGYDSAGRLSTITQGSETFTYVYDQLSRIQGLQRPNGVTTNYQYDAANQLSRLTHNGPFAAIEDFQYRYNPNGEISSIISLQSGTLLTAAKTGAPADAANRMAQFGPAGYSFDNEGQTTSKTDGQGTAVYNWDARGRLTGVNLPGGQSVSYGYDALGRRTSRTAGGVTTNFIYDGADVVRDVLSVGSPIDYLNGPGIDQKLRQTSSNGNLYFIKDHLGSIIALTGGGGGITSASRYEAFGSSGGINLQTRYGYIGREIEGESELLYFRARWYEPKPGRFLLEDPSGPTDDINLYSYALNDPLNNLDPLGLASFQAYYNSFKDNFISSISIESASWIIQNDLTRIAARYSEDPLRTGKILGQVGEYIGPVYDVGYTPIANFFADDKKNPGRDPVERAARYTVDVTTYAVIALSAIVLSPAVAITLSVIYEANRDDILNDLTGHGGTTSSNNLSRGFQTLLNTCDRTNLDIMTERQITCERNGGALTIGGFCNYNR